MIRMFCDACGTEILKNYLAEPLTVDRTFRPDRKVVKVKVEVRASIVDLPDGKQHHLCRDCIIDTVDQADTRPKAMDMASVGQPASGINRSTVSTTEGDLMAQAETTVLASESAVWVHCTPLLISKGPALCGVLPRQPCQCSDGGSHDHLVDAFWARQNRVPPIEPASVDHACCKRHVPGPVFTQFAGEPAPEFICPECGGRWVWDDDEAEGGAWYWHPENDRAAMSTSEESRSGSREGRES